MWCARETTLTFSVMYLSPLTSEVYLLVNLFSKLYVTFTLQWIVGIKRRTSRHLGFKRDSSHFIIPGMWGYNVFAFPFVRSYVGSFVLSVTGSKFLRKSL